MRPGVQADGHGPADTVWYLLVANYIPRYDAHLFNTLQHIHIYYMVRIRPFSRMGGEHKWLPDIIFQMHHQQIYTDTLGNVTGNVIK